MRAVTKEELSFQYFPFYALAYLHDFHLTALSMAAEACYHRLIARQWLAEGGVLPMDPNILRALTKASPAEWKRIWRELEPLFPPAEDGCGRRNAALWQLRQEREAFIEMKRVAGKAGGRPPKNQRNSEKEAADNHHANHNQNHESKHEETTQKARGFSEDIADDNHRGKHSETLELLVEVIPPSPPPGGGGASPAALAVVPPASEAGEAVLPGESLAQYRQRQRPTPKALSDLTTELLATIEHAEGRRAIGRFLDEQRILADRIPNWARRIAGWVNGLGTSGMRPVSWDAVVQGIDEMLDTNPPGQSISPAQLLVFVERAERTRTAPAQPYGPRNDAASKAPAISSAEQEQHTLVAFARDGDTEAIAECERRGIDYARAIA